MKSKRKSTRKRAPTRRKSPAKTPVGGALVPQPHGGALRNGSQPGNTPGTGRPPSAIREHLRGSFAERIPVLEAIADGGSARRVQVPLAEVLKHAHCPKCNGELEADDEDAMVSIEGNASASVRDRLSAVDMMAKYGLGTTKELTVENVRERLKVTLEILKNELTEDQIKSIMPQLKGVWRG